MHLHFGHGDYIKRRFPSDHPIIKISFDEHQEGRDLANKIDRLFGPIQYQLNVDYEYGLLQDNNVYIRIFDQPNERAVDAIQDAKRELENFIFSYGQPWWAILLGMALAALTFLLAISLMAIWKGLVWLQKKFREELGWSQLQSISAVSGISILTLTLLFFMFGGNQLINPSYTQSSSQQVQSYNSGTVSSGQPNQSSSDSESTDSGQDVDVSSPSLSPENIFQDADFPANSCGDGLPTSSDKFPVSFYPVYVGMTDKNLEKITQSFCGDAYAMTRKDAAKKAIQVASFTSLNKADDFKAYLSQFFSGVEIGEPTIVEKKP
jgi:hypothetical protein